MEREIINRESITRIILQKNNLGGTYMLDHRSDNNQNYLSESTLQRISEEEEDEYDMQGKFETPIQKKNETGMPDNLKAGIERLSGFSMDDVRVHYNSSKPASVQAVAYTQGTEIHVAPGQEKHLPHEVWHVAQQMAGRVSPTTNINGMPVNDNAALEHEADVMGAKALQCKIEEKDHSLMRKNDFLGLSPVQMVREEDFKQNPFNFMMTNVVLCDYKFGLGVRMGWDDLATEFLKCMKDNLFDKHYFVLTPFNNGEQTVYILTPAVEKYDSDKLSPNLKKAIKDQACVDKSNISYIEASYVPYKDGLPTNAEENIGHVNVKKKANTSDNQIWNPDFVFTDTMNGCALVTTESEDKNCYSVWHYQSACSNIDKSSLFRREKKVIDWFGDDEYDSISHSSNDYQATIFLWRHDDGWTVCSQTSDIISNTSDKSKKVLIKKVISRELSSSMDSTAQKEKIKRIYLNRLNYLLQVEKNWSHRTLIKNQDVNMLYKDFINYFSSLISVLQEEKYDLKIVVKVFSYLRLVYENLRNHCNMEEEDLFRLKRLEILFDNFKKILEIWNDELEYISSRERESEVGSF